MRAIPKRFQLGPHTVTVRLVTEKEMQAECRKRGDPIPDDENVPMGYTVFDENLVLIRRSSKRFSAEMQMHAYWHEYFHILLERAGRERLARDENLVDTLGGLQMQAFKSAKY